MAEPHDAASTSLQSFWPYPGSPFDLDHPEPHSVTPETIEGLAEVARLVYETGELGVVPSDDATRALDLGLLCVLADRLPYRPAPEDALFL